MLLPLRRIVEARRRFLSDGLIPQRRKFLCSALQAADKHACQDHPSIDKQKERLDSCRKEKNQSMRKHWREKKVGALRACPIPKGLRLLMRAGTCASAVVIAR